MQPSPFLSSPYANHTRGIAIGPILFIIAVLAILAAAIAAGSGSFTAGTSSESANTMASAIIQQSQLIADANAACDDRKWLYGNTN